MGNTYFINRSLFIPHTGIWNVILCMSSGLWKIEKWGKICFLSIWWGPLEMTERWGPLGNCHPVPRLLRPYFQDLCFRTEDFRLVLLIKKRVTHYISSCRSLGYRLVIWLWILNWFFWDRIAIWICGLNRLSEEVTFLVDHLKFYASRSFSNRQNFSRH